MTKKRTTEEAAVLKANADLMQAKLRVADQLGLLRLAELHQQQATDALLAAVGTLAKVKGVNLEQGNWHFDLDTMKFKRTDE